MLLYIFYRFNIEIVITKTQIPRSAFLFAQAVMS